MVLQCHYIYQDPIRDLESFVLVLGQSQITATNQVIHYIENKSHYGLAC